MCLFTQSICCLFPLFCCQSAPERFIYMLNSQKNYSGEGIPQTPPTKFILRTIAYICILFTADNHVTGHVSSAFPGAEDHRTRSSSVNKSPAESMSFITEVICKFIFTDAHMRNDYRPNRAYDYDYCCY